MLDQGFPICGTRTTGGTQKLSKWYAEAFQVLREMFSKNAKKVFVFTETPTQRNAVMSIWFQFIFFCFSIVIHVNLYILYNVYDVTWAASLLGAFFLSAAYLQQQQAATQSNILARVLQNIS